MSVYPTLAPWLRPMAHRPDFDTDSQTILKANKVGPADVANVSKRLSDVSYRQPLSSAARQ